MVKPASFQVPYEINCCPKVIMKIETLKFSNYKGFRNQQTLKLKPVTLLIGKNSSGKSSITKLFLALQKSLQGKIDQPLLLQNRGVELGSEVEHLFNQTIKPLTLKLSLSDQSTLEFSCNLLEKSLKIVTWYYQSSCDDNSQGLDHPCYVYHNPNYAIDSEEDSTDPKVIALHDRTPNLQFKGVIPQGHHIPELGLTGIDLDIDYIGPFRIVPPRYFYVIGETNFKNSGIQGENTYHLLVTNASQDNKLVEAVSQWYQNYLGGWSIKVENEKRKPLVEILLTQGRTEINLVDTGQGMSQALPLVIRASRWDCPDSLIILEQPELHLHPGAHGDLMELFARSAKQHNQTFLIETHAENLLLRLRKLVVENDFNFSCDDVVIYWLEDDGDGSKELREITLDEEGTFSDWPDGVFREGMKDLLAMQRLLRKRESQSL